METSVDSGTAPAYTVAVRRRGVYRARVNWKKPPRNEKYTTEHGTLSINTRSHSPQVSMLAASPILRNGVKTSRSLFVDDLSNFPLRSSQTVAQNMKPSRHRRQGLLASKMMPSWYRHQIRQANVTPRHVSCYSYILSDREHSHAQGNFRVHSPQQKKTPPFPPRSHHPSLYSPPFSYPTHTARLLIKSSRICYMIHHAHLRASANVGARLYCSAGTQNSIRIRLYRLEYFLNRASYGKRGGGGDFNDYLARGESCPQSKYLLTRPKHKT